MVKLKHHLLLTAILLMSVLSASAYDFKFDGIYYNKLSSKEVEVTYGTSTTGSYSGSVTIPKTVYYDGVSYKVVSIGIDAFSTCKSLTSVTIGANVTSVGKRAFDACSALAKVYFQSSRMSLEKNAFRNCTNISELHYANINNIVNYSFAEYESSPLYCSHGSIYDSSTLVENYQTPSYATTIPAYAFYGCSSIKSVTFESSNKINVGTKAFYNCSSLSNMYINTSIDTDEYAFYGTNLQSVDFGQKVDACFSYNALPYQNKITRVNFSDTYSMCSLSYKMDKSLSYNYLYYNSPDIYVSGVKITKVIIPSGIEKIADGAFYGLKSLGSVEIPSSVKEIGAYAFYECTSLNGITLKYGLEKINKNAFYGCSGISWVDLPSSLQYIGSYAFYNTSIPSFYVPNSVNTLEKYALNNGNTLTSVVLMDGENPIEWLDETTDEASFEYTHLSDIYIGRPLNFSFSYSYDLFGPHRGNIVNYLKKITFGECVKEIPARFFANISDYYYLNEIKVISVEPPTLLSEIKLNSYALSNCFLNVPKESKGLYVAHPYWGKLNIVEYYDPSFDVNIKDTDSSYKHEKDKMYSSITYTRTFNNTNWQALYVPFAMSYDDWKNDFEVAEIADVQQFDDDNDGKADRTKIEARKLEAGESTTANTPYFIKAKTTGEKTIAVAAATLYATAENTLNKKSMNTDFDFTGTYNTVANMATKGYYAMSGGKLCQAESNAATLNPFRWYLSVKDTNGNNVNLAKTFSCFFDNEEETTDTKTVNETTEQNISNSIFTIDGRFVGKDEKSLCKGLYIKNKKVFTVQ